ncbi:MAG: hypothetical protein ACQER1_07275 [Armatimonadota bacterium]
MITRRGRPSSGRRGTVIPTALSFAGAAILLVWLAVNSLAGPYAGTPRRQLLAVGSIILATAGFAVAMAVVVSAVRRRRRLNEHTRPGEVIIRTFAAELLDPGRGATASRAHPIGLTFTNQRLLIHDPPDNADPDVSLEHNEIARAIDHGPTPGGILRRFVAHELLLKDGTSLMLRVDADAGLDFIDLRGRYLDRRKRELRALVIEARGPTPSRVAQPLDRILVDGRPSVCLLELDEHYLRLTGEHSPPLADLYYYFHWDHMDVGSIEPAEIEGLPKRWRRLRLRFHGTSSLVICGSEDAIRRVRQKAIAGGAATTRQGPSPIGA